MRLIHDYTVTVDYVFSLSNAMSMLDPFIPYLVEVTAVNVITDITSEISEITVFTQQGCK